MHPPHEYGPRLSRLKGIRHGFFGRQGGVSTGLYDSLNLGKGSGDDAQAIRDNRDRVTEAMGADHLISCFQIHSADVITVTEPWNTRPKGDAMVTKQPGIALCILTADCVPVLLADEATGIIGAAHAGWKGALAGVCEATINAMEALGANREAITAAIGPAIQQASYEVGPEFRDTFVGEKEWTDRLFKPGRGDRLHFDLTGYVQTILQREGISAVDNLGLDTCTLEEAYFSNRRRNLRGEDDYGRNGSVIMLESEIL
ncbi:peptidoglycan editing factor PgeF [Hyphomonas sp. FCG-A18]|uniref:peptidoglycan editing factor PgeF n=1 Tax=Hyphomonas sp. FCG-A18 TaxID=3080019 RepID=UPI002B2CC841|nr:peptidoglycan editing factor PgeF [Hyphomonas sp. FCG-A18]